MVQGRNEAEILVVTIRVLVFTLLCLFIYLFINFFIHPFICLSIYGVDDRRGRGREAGRRGWGIYCVCSSSCTFICLLVCSFISISLSICLFLSLVFPSRLSFLFSLILSFGRIHFAFSFISSFFLYVCSSSFVIFPCFSLPSFVYRAGGERAVISRCFL